MHFLKFLGKEWMALKNQNVRWSVDIRSKLLWKNISRKMEDLKVREISIDSKDNIVISITIILRDLIQKWFDQQVVAVISIQIVHHIHQFLIMIKIVALLKWFNDQIEKKVKNSKNSMKKSKNSMKICDLSLLNVILLISIFSLSN